MKPRKLPYGTKNISGANIERLRKERNMKQTELIGSVIQSFRLSKGLTQEVLSGLADLDRTHYSKIERGQRSPTIDTLFKIAHALDIPPHELVKGIEKALEEQEI